LVNELCEHQNARCKDKNWYYQFQCRSEHITTKTYYHKEESEII